MLTVTTPLLTFLKACDEAHRHNAVAGRGNYEHYLTSTAEQQNAVHGNAYV